MFISGRSGSKGQQNGSSPAQDEDVKLQLLRVLWQGGGVTPVSAHASRKTGISSVCVVSETAYR